MPMTELSDLIPAVESLSTARILCVGDVMLDHYIYGRVNRISPEAPIPVLRIEREQSTLGGAGNVLRNVLTLGGEACFISVIGDDPAGRDINRLIAAEGEIEAYLLVERDRPSTVKTRFVGANQQMLRADRESVAPLSEHVREDLLRLAADAIADHTITVISDYGKGVLASGVAAAIIDASVQAGRPVVVDPKGLDYTRYRGATVLTPNRHELAEATKMPADTDAEIIEAARHLIDTCGVGAVLVTRSQDGMTLVEPGAPPRHLAAAAREVYDVSGAGDTVIATLAAGLGSGLSLLDSARLANVAAGIVVGKVGTAVVHAAELVATISNPADEVKVLPLELALDRIARWRRAGHRVGFTNGCFDIIHPGHVSLLTQAKSACDRLVVGLNSDASVQRLKGPTRPVQPAEARAAVLSSLGPVDLVVVFEEDTPMRLIEAVRPEVLAKGADYRVDQVVGADLVQSYGGTVLLADLTPGQSTTATIARIAAG